LKCRIDVERPPVDVSGRKLRSWRSYIHGVCAHQEGNGKAKRLNLFADECHVQLFLPQNLPRQFSPDGKWVLTAYPSGIRPTSAPQLLLLPTGLGQPVTLTHDSISHGHAILLPDGERILFEGNEPGRAGRNWLQDVSGGKPAPITPEGTVGHSVSPDGKLLVAVDLEQRFWLYPIEGGQPRALSGVAPGEDVVRWSAGKHLFVARGGIPARVYRVDAITGRRQLVYTLAPSDAAGLWSIWPVLLTPDGKSYVYSDYRILSDLYLATGLR
jgi:hypothetical protein